MTRRVLLFASAFDGQGNAIVVEVIGRQAPVLVIRAEQAIEERKPCGVVDEIAALAVVQLVGMVVHEDVAEPADIVGDAGMVGGLEQQNEPISDERGGQVHTEQPRNDDERRLELAERRIGERRLITAEEVQLGDGMMCGVLFAVEFQNRVSTAAVAHEVVNEVIREVEQHRGGADEPPIVIQFAVERELREDIPAPGDESTTDGYALDEHHE